MNAIHIAMPYAGVFGAGTCGRHLLAEFAKRMPTYYDHVPGDDVSPGCDLPWGARYRPLASDITIPLLQFAGPDMSQQTRYRGSPNAAYIFSEKPELTQREKDNLRAFDVLVAGSTWNAEVLRAAGFECAAVAQGVDTEVFKPDGRLRRDDRFVIYSGGKWEHRKGQDIVVKAVKVMQERHKDVELIACWVNLWNQENGYAWAKRQGVKLYGYPLTSAERLAVIMNATDVGLFPNRCEGGTNLVLMDYLACGRPVVASVSTGQADVLDPSYCFDAAGDDDEMLARAIDGLEYFYAARDEMRRMGSSAADAMKAWPWSRTAAGITAAINAQEAVAA